MKKIIGIVPGVIEGDMTQDCMSKYYKFGNTYTTKLAKLDCIPVGLTPADDYLSEEQLELCDGFLFMGGDKYYPYHFQVIHHAITRGKRYLGICLGEQVIYSYFETLRLAKEYGYAGDDLQMVLTFRRDHPKERSVVPKVEGHRFPFVGKGMEDTVKHDIHIVPGTILHRLLGRDTARIASFHNLAVPADQPYCTVNAWSALGDGVVEGLEYGENILSIQGHPEIDDLMPEIFTFLTDF